MHSSTQQQFTNLAASPFFHPAFSYAFRSIEASMPIHPAFLPPTSLTAPSGGHHSSAFSAAAAVGTASKGRSFTIDAILGNDSANNISSDNNRSSDEENDNIIHRRHRRFESHPYLNALTSHMRFNTNQSVADLHSQKEKVEKICGKTDWKPTKSKRVRTIFTPEQLERLETEFELQQYMVGTERFYLASSLNLTEAQVKVWFQNRRIKWRKQNLEQQHAKLAKLNLLRVGDGGDDDEADSASENDETDERRSETSSPVMQQYMNFHATSSVANQQSELFNSYSTTAEIGQTKTTISPTLRISSD